MQLTSRYELASLPCQTFSSSPCFRPASSTQSGAPMLRWRTVALTGAARSGVQRLTCVLCHRRSASPAAAWPRCTVNTQRLCDRTGMGKGSGVSCVLPPSVLVCRDAADSLRDFYYSVAHNRVQGATNLMLEAWHWLRAHHPYWCVASPRAVLAWFVIQCMFAIQCYSRALAAGAPPLPYHTCHSWNCCCAYAGCSPWPTLLESVLYALQWGVQVECRFNPAGTGGAGVTTSSSQPTTKAPAGCPLRCAPPSS